MTVQATNVEQIRLAWQENWPKARSIWSPFVKLREPVWCLTAREAADEGLTGSFAMIRLNDHRIVINLEQVAQYDVADFSVQVLAHEIGHHVYSPANLHDNALLLARIRWGLADIEDRAGFVANLYADFLINDVLQRTKNLDMAVVYQQLNKDIAFSKLWLLVMRTYEYLWKLKRGTLASALELHSATIDADASLTASLVRSYSKRWLDGGGRFAALLYPYLLEEKEYEKARASMIRHLDAEYAGQNGGIVTGMAELDAEAMDGAVDPRTEGYGKNTAPGSGFGKTKQGGDGPKQRYLSPGEYIDLFRQINPDCNEQELINHYYREIALPHLISFPLEKVDISESTIPEGTDTWDVGEPMEEIDWLESALSSSQMIPGYNTRKRLYGPDDDNSHAMKPLDVYIGIDCSGSMTNPRQGFSWPVLAATIIGLSALRAGANVMGCLSGEPGTFLETDGFSTSEKEILTVLTSYLGTGYAYGVPRLNTPFSKPCKAKSHVIVVSDDDLFSMLDANTDTKISNWTVIENALTNAGGHGTIVLHSKPEWRQAEVKRLEAMGWRVYYVTDEPELLAFAAEFADANYQSRR